MTSFHTRKSPSKTILNNGNLCGTNQNPVQSPLSLLLSFCYVPFVTACIICHENQIFCKKFYVVSRLEKCKSFLHSTIQSYVYLYRVLNCQQHANRNLFSFFFGCIVIQKLISRIVFFFCICIEFFNINKKLTLYIYEKCKYGIEKSLGAYVCIYFFFRY